MPSFLSKVLGRKKNGKDSSTHERHGSDGSLLGGRFEVVSPVSPTITEFPENAPRRNGKERDGAFGMFRVKSRQSRPSSPEPQKKEDLPQLSLILPVSKEDAQTPALGVAFEADPDAQILSDDVIGSRRLTPLEALSLVRICSQAIVARGLKSLGLMHPHWYSASPDIQRRLISLFIHSLNSNNTVTTLSPNSSPLACIFESEINYTRSPHDVAAVLRWGLRHLELEGKKFGKEESWYKTFAQAERSLEYPPNAYSEQLAPLVPPAHLELINATLDLFSSLAAHAEENSTSGSKLTKAFGLWLLAAQRVEENDDWRKFYARWQGHGQVLEHLFLARIRDESLRLRMPTRLSELVTQYPYVRGSANEGEVVYLRPQLSTRHFDALFVRVETEYSSPEEKAHQHPLQFLKDAFAADVAVEANEYLEVWEKIRKSGNDENGVSPGGYPGLGRVFADETIRCLTLVSGDHPLKKATSPTFSISGTPQGTPTSRRWASSPTSAEDDVKPPNGITNGHGKPASEPSPLPSAISSLSPPDWNRFSSTGFSDVSPSIAPLASTLFGRDVEKTNPPFRRPSRRSRISSPPRSPRKSVEVTPPRDSNVSLPAPPKLVSKSIPVSIVQVDEAFIEFWVDALLDPISSTWPNFVLCKLRSPLSDPTLGDKPIQYVVMERIFVPKQSPLISPEVKVAEPVGVVASPSKSVIPSPKSSTKSEKRFFGFFTSSGRNSGYGSDKLFASTSKGKKRASPQARVNELGERIKEDEDKPTTTVRLRIPSPKPRKSTDVSRKSVDAIRLSMDARKSTEVPNAVETITSKVEESKDVAVGATSVAGASVNAVASVLVEEDKPTIPPLEVAEDEKATSPPADEAAKFVNDTPKPIEDLAKVTEGVDSSELQPLTEPEARSTFMAPGALQVEEQSIPSSMTAMEATADDHHTLTANVEKTEEVTTLPTPLPSVEPDNDANVPQADIPNPPTKELAQAIDIFAEKDLPASISNGTTPAEALITEPAAPSLINETSLEEAAEPVVSAESGNGGLEQQVSSITAPEVTLEEVKEEETGAPEAMPVVEPVVDQTPAIRPSEREAVVDAPSDNNEESIPEVVVMTPGPAEDHQEANADAEIVQEEVVEPVVEEVEAAVEHLAPIEESAAVAEDSPLVSEGTIPSGQSPIDEKPLVEELSAVEETPVEEPLAEMEHLVEEPATVEEHVTEQEAESPAQDVPLAETVNLTSTVEDPEILGQMPSTTPPAPIQEQTVVSEEGPATVDVSLDQPATSAAVEDSTDVQAPVDEELAHHEVQEPAGRSVMTEEDTNQTEAMEATKEHTPELAAQTIGISGHTSAEQPANPTATQQAASTTETTEELPVESEGSLAVATTPTTQEDDLAIEPQPVDVVPVTEHVPVEVEGPPPQAETGAEVATEQIISPDELENPVEEVTPEVQDAGALIDASSPPPVANETAAPAISDSTEQPTSDSPESPERVPETIVGSLPAPTSNLEEEDTLGLPAANGNGYHAAEPEKESTDEVIHTQTTSVEAKHDAEPTLTQISPAEPPAPFEPPTEALEITKEE